ncbi:hypothetical protein BH683_025780 [Williamsia sp. 1138]|nr:hypothetical protein BH683_025780 [Williamsia sp. 1138]
MQPFEALQSWHRSCRDKHHPRNLPLQFTEDSTLDLDIGIFPNKIGAIGSTASDRLAELTQQWVAA